MPGAVPGPVLQEPQPVGDGRRVGAAAELRAEAGGPALRGGEGTGHLLRVLRSHRLELPTVQSWGPLQDHRAQVPKDQLSPVSRPLQVESGPCL